MVFPKIKVPVLQNRVFDDQNEAKNSDFGFISLKKNNKSGIYENEFFDSSKIIYDANYDNEQSNSVVFRNHLANIIELMIPYMIDKKVIEVGCGKGHFFDMLISKGIDCLGCDPTYTGNSKRIVKKFFSKELNLSGDFIILRHVLEHIQDPISFLKMINEVNGKSALIYIEVPDFNWIIKNQTYFDIFYEHVNYFRPIDFQNIFGSIIDQGLVFGGQYQYVIAKLESIRNPPYQFGLEDDVDPISFLKLKDLAEYLTLSKKKIFIWGAASKGVILAIHLDSLGVPIENLIDININKQNKYIPITGIRVISPQEFIQQNTSAILVIANPNYENEIKSLTAELNDISYIVV